MPSRLLPKHKSGMKKGQTNNPAGKPKGIRNRRPGFIRRLTEKETSLDFLRLTYKDGQMPMAFRVQAAGLASPYEHQKKPIAIEGTDKPIPVIDAAKLRNMPAKDLKTIAAGLAALGLSPDGPPPKDDE